MSCGSGTASTALRRPARGGSFAAWPCCGWGMLGLLPGGYGWPWRPASPWQAGMHVWGGCEGHPGPSLWGGDDGSTSGGLWMAKSTGPLLKPTEKTSLCHRAACPGAEQGFVSTTALPLFFRRVLPLSVLSIPCCHGFASRRGTVRVEVTVKREGCSWPSFLGRRWEGQPVTIRALWPSRAGSGGSRGGSFATLHRLGEGGTAVFWHKLGTNR